MIYNKIKDNHLLCIFIFFSFVQFLTVMLVGDLFGSDRAHVFIYEEIGGEKPRFAEHSLLRYFSMKSIHYRPLSVFIEGGLSNLYKFNGYNFHFFIIMFNALLGGLLACLIFKITKFFNKSFLCGFIACILGCWSLANIVSSWYILFSFFQIIILLINAILIFSYLKCLNNKNNWLYVLLFFGLIGPWFREACLFSIIAILFHQIISFPNKKNLILLVSCSMISAHAIFPTFIPNILGIYQYEVTSVFSGSQVSQNLGQKWINFIRAGRFIREFPMTLWMITMLPIAIYIYFLFKNNFNITALYQNFIDGSNFIKVKSVRFDITMKMIILLTLCFFLFSFSQLFLYTKFPHTEFINYKNLISQDFLLLYFLFVFCIISCFRFGAIIPFWALSGLPSLITFFENNESHMSFSSFPLALLLSLWISDAFKYSNIGLLLKGNKFLIRKVIIILFFVGIFDHISTVSNSFFSNTKLKQDVINISNKLYNYVKKNDLVFVNNIVSFEIFDRSVELQMGKRISNGGSYPVLPRHEIYDLAKQREKIKKAFKNNKRVFYFLLASKNNEYGYQIPNNKYKILFKESIKYRYLSFDPFVYHYEKPAYMKFIGPSRWHVIFDTTYSFTSDIENEAHFVLLELDKDSFR